jgi:hypothetical protein
LSPDVRSKVIWEARIALALWGEFVVWAIASRSVVPLLFFGGSTVSARGF